MEIDRNKPISDPFAGLTPEGPAQAPSFGLIDQISMMVSGVFQLFFMLFGGFPSSPPIRDVEQGLPEAPPEPIELTQWVKQHPYLVAGAAISVTLVTAAVCYRCFQTPRAKPFEFTVFTAYTTDNPARTSLSRKVAANQAQYCAKRGYEHLTFETNLAQDVAKGEKILPYWAKIAGMNKLLNDPTLSHKKWFVWMDDDLIVTNKQIKLEDVVLKVDLKGDESFFLTQDAESSIRKEVPFNTAALFVKNNAKSRELFKALWQMRHSAPPNMPGTAYATCPNQSCLHEQQALTELLKKSPRFRSFTKIIPQRVNGIGINTFHRPKHFDRDRHLFLDYNDPKETQWHQGDFLGQCTGLATNAWIPDVEHPVNLRERCVDQLIARSR
jgi:hypothetical protein